MKQEDEGDISAQSAAHGEKMIEVKVRFWTNNIASAGQVQPKHAWSSGVVRVARNKSHSISPGRPRPFNSLLDIGSAIEEVLIEHGILLLPSDRMAKYVVDRPKNAGKKK